MICSPSVEGLQSNTWTYVEFKWLIDETVGTFEIRVNTIPVLTYTGDTLAIGVRTRSGCGMRAALQPSSRTDAAPKLTMRFSDLYLADLDRRGRRRRRTSSATA